MKKTIRTALDLQGQKTTPFGFSFITTSKASFKQSKDGRDPFRLVLYHLVLGLFRLVEVGEVA